METQLSLYPFLSPSWVPSVFVVKYRTHETFVLQDEYVLRVIVESENDTTATEMLKRFKSLKSGDNVSVDALSRQIFAIVSPVHSYSLPLSLSELILFAFDAY